jgi:hypothetical protein
VDKKTLHYKKVIDTYLVTKYHTYNEIGDNSVREYTKRLNENKYGCWAELETDKVSEEEFKSNYGNTVSKVSSEKVTIVVEEYPNKISCKVYQTERIRRVGSSYFRVRKYLTYITYNFKYNNFYSGTISKKNKKILSKKVRVNDFNGHVFSSLNLEIRRHLRDNELRNNNFSKRVPKENSKLSWQVTKKYSDRCEHSNDIMDIFLSRIKERCGVNKDIRGKDYEVKFFQLYLETNKFKYPNNYREYVQLSIPKKLLRKQTNLVSLYMNVNELNGRKIRKILNVGHDLDFEVLNKVYTLLGVDYFNKVNSSVFVKSNLHFSSNFKVEKVNLETSNFHKQNIVNVLNDGLNLHSLIEHFNMVKELEDKHGHKFKVKFKDIEQFNNEHYDVSELLQSYRKGVVTRYYGDGVTSLIEGSVTDLVGVEYYPKVLMTTNDYNEESQTQKNCVRTYVENPNNIIISLRVGSKDSKLRATIEYRFIGNTLKRVQSLGSKNSKLTPMWDTILEILDDKINSLYRSDTLKTPELSKVYRSGRIITRKSKYDGVILRWDNEDEIDDIGNIDLPF